MLKGEAKKTYQREYMRRKRSKERMALLFGILQGTGADVEMVGDTNIRLKEGLLDPPTSRVVRPDTVEVIEEWTPTKRTIRVDGKVMRTNRISRFPFVIVQPAIDADGNAIYEEG